jgi:hypothetical protein
LKGTLAETVEKKQIPALRMRQESEVPNQVFLTASRKLLSNLINPDAFRQSIAYLHIIGDNDKDNVNNLK